MDPSMVEFLQTLGANGILGGVCAYLLYRDYKVLDGLKSALNEFATAMEILKERIK